MDYKVSLEEGKPKSWLKSVSAFANTNGGYILFGVTNDTHEAIGLDDSQHTASKIAELISARITPAPRYSIESFPSDSGERNCVCLTIQNGPSYPYYYTHEKTMEVYVRHGDRSEVASPIELNNLILRGQNKTFDSLPSYYGLSDVSFTLLGATYKKEVGEELIFPRDLISMGFLTEDGQITNAGLLLCDQGYLKQSRIVCTRWKGNEKGSIDGDALDDQEYSDVSLITLLNNTEAFIRNNSKNPWTIRGMRREENSDYPFRAVREVLVNAMIHRDYQIVGTEIHVDMFDDRMEITSPGGMLNGSRIQDLDLRRVPSMRRNEIISDMFGRLHYMDRRGSGIGRILSSYSGFSEKPEFFSNEYFFSVSLPNRSVALSAQVEFTDPEKLTEAEKSQLSTEKTQLSLEKSQLSAEKSQLKDRINTGNYTSEDWELKYFKKMVRDRCGNDFRRKTIDRVIELFSRYRYQYNFNRRNIADAFGVSENAASGFINKFIEKDIIEKVKTDEYRFVEQEDT